MPQSRYYSYDTGAYFNSYKKWSLYGGADWHTVEVNGFRAGVLLGGVTGYDDSFLLVSPNIVYRYKRIRATLNALPTDIPVVGLSFGYRF